MLIPHAIAVAQADGETDGSKVDRAIDKGLGYLVDIQLESGVIADRQYDTTMSSLSVIAFAAAGHLPADNNEFGDASGRALQYVLRSDRADPTGYYGKQDGSKMYGHGITTLMLTEMLGMGKNALQNELIHARCSSAIKVILSAQNRSKALQYDGGWRYTPASLDSDLSVSVWCLLALRSAKNAGMDVPDSAIARAIAYLKRSYTSPLSSSGKPMRRVAGFSYLPNNSNPTFAMTAAGLLAMQVCGQYDSPLVLGSSQYLLEHPPKWKDRYFYYGMYYYAQGMHQRGGEYAETAEKNCQRLLLEHQEASGAWASPGGEELSAGRVYATCMAILSLSVKYHYLPIYQR
ncbi:MAG TPA: hypothetical protein DDW52_11135 [Planctomycetaceae bacterium]|nr:hypothetical protein [Planctomycetaceae bacterium]